MSSTTKFYGTKKDAVQFVANQLPLLKLNLPWTMTISRGMSEDCFVIIVTDELLDDIEKNSEQICSKQDMNILSENILATSSLLK